MISFSMPTKILAGNGVIEQIGEVVRDYGERILLVYDKDALKETKYFGELRNLLEKNSFGVLLYNCSSTGRKLNIPSYELINEGASQAAIAKCDTIVGIGCIGTLYAAKSISLLSKAGGKIEDYTGEHRIGISAAKRKASYIEIPISYNLIPGLTDTSYISDNSLDELKVMPSRGEKADLVIMDPSLISIQGGKTNAYNGIHLLSLAIESLISKQVNLLGESFSLQAVDILFKYLESFLKDTSNVEYREFIMKATILSSLAFGNSTPGVSFALSLLLSKAHNLEQSILSTILLPHIMEFNVTSVANDYLRLYNMLGESRTDMTVVQAAVKMIESVKKLIEETKLSRKLSELNIERSNFLKVSKIALSYDFMKYVPQVVAEEELTNILDCAY